MHGVSQTSYKPVPNMYQTSSEQVPKTVPKQFQERPEQVPNKFQTCLWALYTKTVKARARELITGTRLALVVLLITWVVLGVGLLISVAVVACLCFCYNRVHHQDYHKNITRTIPVLVIAPPGAVIDRLKVLLDALRRFITRDTP